MLTPELCTASEKVRCVPEITVLLCTDRDDKLLNRAIRSCLSQSFRNFEILIIANGANALDLSCILKYRYISEPRITVHATEIRDLNFSLDFGLHLASGEFLARMDSDDEMHPDRLTIQHDYLRNNPEVGVVGSFYTLIDQHSVERGLVRLPIFNAQIRFRMYYSSPFCHPSVTFRTNLIRKAGGYRGGKSAEDYDLWSRLHLDHSIVFHNIPEFLLRYNVDEEGESRRSRTAYANVAGVQLRNFLLSWNIHWLLGTFFTISKLIFKSNKA